MVPVIYQVERIGSGWLAIMGRPRSGEWAASEFAGLSQLGVTDVISLLEPGEASELELSNEASLCEGASMAFHSFPIPDRGTPRSAHDLSKLACSLYHSSAGGRGIAVHCRAGIGRSGIVAAAVLLHCGHTPQEAFDQLTKVRGVTVPDTVQQAQWLIDNRLVIAQCHLERRGSWHGSPGVV